MDATKTALVLIGFQNDYFAADGILRAVIDETARVSGVLQNTIEVVERLAPSPVLMVSTPIVFTADYGELKEPVGILKTIKEVGAFREGAPGSQTIQELSRFGDRILEVPGKRGLNAFSNTDLAAILEARQITNVVLAGVVTSICIDSTGRSAHERGHRVTVLSDCTCGRTLVEQDFYCSEIFPLYADVIDRGRLFERLEL
jgi:nicotinamidase-related amidase